nr:PD-(D/E)XK nuclease family transposase [Natroniella sulfidigena]
MIAFLNAVFGTKGTEEEIVEVKIDNAEINKDWDEDKLSRLDVKATANNNTKVNHLRDEQRRLLTLHKF